MEEYANNNTIVKDDLYNIFKDSVTCSLCNNILINPVMCMVCQNNFCKKCIDNRSLNNKNCPNGCNEPNYKDSIGKKDILSKLKFNCVGCQNKIPYDEIVKHHEYCCPDKKSSDIDKTTPTPSKLQRVSSDDIAELKKEGKEMVYITRKPKQYNFYNFI